MVKDVLSVEEGLSEPRRFNRRETAQRKTAGEKPQRISANLFYDIK